MKRTLRILGLVCLATLIAYLGVTKRLAEDRAARLDRALMDAETRTMHLEADLETANHRLAASNPSGEALAAAGQRATSAVAPTRYVSAASGVTNLVRIEGTSTVHYWQVEGHLIGGSAEFGPGFPPAPGAAPPPGPVQASVKVFIPVRSLKSVEKDGSLYSDAMDEIMYGKLSEPTNKRITFTLTSFSLKLPRDPSSPLVYDAAGDLVVAGETNRITMPVAVTPDPNGKIQFAGSVKVKMTDFKISPPAPALAGVQISTGDEVTLKFIWWAKPLETIPAKR